MALAVPKTRQVMGCPRVVEGKDRQRVQIKGRPPVSTLEQDSFMACFRLRKSWGQDTAHLSMKEGPIT